MGNPFNYWSHPASWPRIRLIATDCSGFANGAFAGSPILDWHALRLSLWRRPGEFRSQRTKKRLTILRG